MAKDTYKSKAWCSTCGKEVQVDIPKGKTRKEHLMKKVVCPICGCKTCGLEEN